MMSVAKKDDQCTRDSCKYLHPPKLVKEELQASSRAFSQTQTALQQLCNPLQMLQQPQMCAAQNMISPWGFMVPQMMPLSFTPTAVMIPEVPCSGGRRKDKSDKLEVCREYQRSQCPRGNDECKYAHPEPHIHPDPNDNMVTVCMDFMKERCERESCRYFHPPPHLQARVKANQLNASSLMAAAAQSQALALGGSTPLTTSPPTSGAPLMPVSSASLALSSLGASQGLCSQSAFSVAPTLTPNPALNPMFTMSGMAGMSGMSGMSAMSAMNGMNGLGGMQAYASPSIYAGAGGFAGANGYAGIQSALAGAGGFPAGAGGFAGMGGFAGAGLVPGTGLVPGSAQVYDPTGGLGGLHLPKDPIARSTMLAQMAAEKAVLNSRKRKLIDSMSGYPEMVKRQALGVAGAAGHGSMVSPWNMSQQLALQGALAGQGMSAGQPQILTSSILSPAATALMHQQAALQGYTTAYAIPVSSGSYAIPTPYTSTAQQAVVQSPAPTPTQ